MRTATITRNTSETQITVSLNLDGTGKARFDTGIPFLEHMLDQIARHGLIDLDIVCHGDLHIDDHHSVEDIGITLGQALKAALGDKIGIRRYGHSYVPLDEELSRVVLDLSGRAGLEYNIDFTRATCAARTPTTKPKPCSKPSDAPCAWRWNTTSAWLAKCLLPRGRLPHNARCVVFQAAFE